ncbi:MAG: hypothetical protein GY872_16600 [Roseibacillus sp.]|nr:hypothetical protein [Roseibacillus sp.]
MADWDEEDNLMVALLVACNGGYHYQTRLTKIPLYKVHEVYPTHGGRYRMEAWLDIGYEFHSHEEIYDIDDGSDTDDSFIVSDSEFCDEW